MRKYYIYIILIIFVFSAYGCKPKVEKVEDKPVIQLESEKEVSLNITTTNKLLYHMVSDIIKDRNSLDYMFTTKEKLLNFKFTEDSINNISKKDLFFYWGSGLEPWSQEFVDKLSKSRVGPINVSRGVKFINFQKEAKENPYFWMNVYNYKIAMLNIKNAIQDKDTKSRDFYEENFSKSIKEVEECEKKLKETFEKLKEHTFIVDEEELDYFTKYYGFKAITTKDLESNNNSDDKFKENKNLIFLYNNEEIFKSKEYLIKERALKTVKIVLYSNDMKYIDMLNTNLKGLEALIEPSK